ncbi:phosphatase [Oceanirhabdus sp. W0125-5]|uniref:phosphatase n=1 Tax=Oceanirhabdus sp. W0125-5 TaxID=2999116 RepID=UPI0022F3321C|nr:phosphatase [Oceanirhabdus sp. W0125-5]WBW94738.1 phosphatase [Oceanirhabdus sp. W0125-5]
MNKLIDLHTHTMAGGHGYSTLQENIQQAKKRGLKILGYSEHGPKMPGGPHIFHIANQRVIPRIVDDIIILKGCEANIIDYEGNIDIPVSVANKLDYMIASLHDVCIENGGVENNTRAILKAMENPNVMIIGHPGNPQFPINEEAVIKRAKELNVLIEINNSSFGSSRPGSKEKCMNIAKLCMEHDVEIVLGSDSHISYSIGDFTLAMKELKKIGFDEKLIINNNCEKFLKFLRSKGKVEDIKI